VSTLLGKVACQFGLKVPFANKEKILWTVERPTNLTHRVAKGGLEEIQKEFDLMKGGDVLYSKDALARVFGRYDEMLSSAFYEKKIKSVEDFLAAKNKQAKPGEPYVNLAGSFVDFYYLTPGDSDASDDRKSPFGEGDPTRRQKFIEYLEDWEAQVLCGGYQTTFLVHAKCAAFSLKKVEEDRYRSIKASDLLLHYLMYKYCSDFSETLEEMNPRWGIKLNTALWHEKICKRFGKNSIASDFTGYEYSQGKNLQEAIIRGVVSRTRAPPEIADFIVDSVVHAPFIFADGEIFVRSGTNPSGHFLTSVQNTIYHEVIIEDVAVKFAMQNQLQWVTESTQVVDFDITGDDNVTRALGPKGGEPYLDIVEYGIFLTEEAWERYGVVTKLDLTDGNSAYQGTHPAYLACCSTHIDGYCVQLYAAPARSLARFQSINPDRSADLVEAYLGIRAANWGYVVLNAMYRKKGWKLAVPQCVFEFFTFFQQNMGMFEWRSEYLSATTLLENYTGRKAQCGCKQSSCKANWLPMDLVRYILSYLEWFQSWYRTSLYRGIAQEPYPLVNLAAHPERFLTEFTHMDPDGPMSQTSEVAAMQRENGYISMDAVIDFRAVIFRYKNTEWEFVPSAHEVSPATGAAIKVSRDLVLLRPNAALEMYRRQFLGYLERIAPECNWSPIVPRVFNPNAGPKEFPNIPCLRPNVNENAEFYMDLALHIMGKPGRTWENYMYVVLLGVGLMKAYRDEQNWRTDGRNVEKFTIDANWYANTHELLVLFFSFDSTTLVFQNLTFHPNLRDDPNQPARELWYHMALRRLMLSFHKLEFDVGDYCRFRRRRVAFRDRSRGGQIMRQEWRVSERESRLQRLFNGRTFLIVSIMKHLDSDPKTEKPFCALTPPLNMAGFKVPRGYTCGHLNGVTSSEGNKYPCLLACHCAKLYGYAESLLEPTRTCLDDTNWEDTKGIRAAMDEVQRESYAIRGKLYEEFRVRPCAYVKTENWLTEANLVDATMNYITAFRIQKVYEDACDKARELRMDSIPLHPFATFTPSSKYLYKMRQYAGMDECQFGQDMGGPGYTALLPWL
jgi:hypothetical protein